MVKSIIGEVVTYYPNASYELRVEGTSETELKYYFTGSVRIAMRENEAIIWLLSDHLGSTSVTVDASGSLLSSLKFTAYGELRSGSSTTDYQYTGQRNEVEIGLYYYVARFYDPQLARFISADTIIPEPGKSQGYDRYAYVNGNPISFNDPSGHCPLCVSAAIGAGIGAVVGGVGYGIYITATGNEFKWGQLALAAGGGLAAGALIGTGVGWAAGVSQATATTAAITGAGTAASTATTVLSVTGGDPSDEFNTIKQGIQGAGPAIARAVGRAGEVASGIIKNTSRIKSLTNTANYRIPDQLLDNPKVLSEIKNVSTLPFTNQIKDFVAYSQQKNYTFELWTRATTQISQPLQKLITDGQIIHRILEIK